jgi:mannosyltransferase
MARQLVGIQGTRWRRIGWMLCLLAALALRLYRLDGQSLWYDEAVTADLARRSFGELTRWTANDIQPPLYYYVVAIWGRLAGWSEWSLRFPSAWFGVLGVPLLALVARRLTDTRAVAGLAALLVALHPLLVYYSQEARMYTLLAALSILTVNFGMRLAHADWRTKDALGYGLAATAAIYTHYFAFFLLAALALAVWLHRPPRTTPAPQPRRADPFRALSFTAQPALLTHPFALATAGVCLLYLPWLGAMLNRFNVDRSYWQGALKIGEAMRSVAITFTGGESVTEPVGGWLLLPYGLVTLMALYRLVQASRSASTTAPTAGHTLWYAGLWLSVPVAGVLALAAFAPKFNPRYVLIALPGLLLIWSAGLAWPRTEPDRLGNWRIWATGGMLLLTAGALYSNANWFFNPAFTKDDWRGLIAFLRPRLEANETVVLSSGHAEPAWRYYAPDLPVVRLPAIDVLDVDAVLTFPNTAEPLRAAFAETSGINGAWLVQWQDEVVDPTGIAPVQLELGGREKGQSAQFWGLKLRRFSRIRPQRIVDAPPITHRLDLNLGDQIEFTGYHVMENGDLLLFWQRLAASAGLADDYQITGETVTPDGNLVAQVPDRRPSAYTYPVARWRSDEVVMGHLPAVDWLGPTPAMGTYTFRLTVYGLQGETPQPLAASDGRTTIELPVMIEEFD